MITEQLKRTLRSPKPVVPGPNYRELNSWHADWNKEYLAGIMLLDLEDPAKIIGICQDPLMLSEADYELNGFRGSVIFPVG